MPTIDTFVIHIIIYYGKCTFCGNGLWQRVCSVQWSPYFVKYPIVTKWYFAKYEGKVGQIAWPLRLLWRHIWSFYCKNVCIMEFILLWSSFLNSSKLEWYTWPLKNWIFSICNIHTLDRIYNWIYPL